MRLWEKPECIRGISCTVGYQSSPVAGVMQCGIGGPLFVLPLLHILIPLSSMYVLEPRPEYGDFGRNVGS